MNHMDTLKKVLVTGANGHVGFGIIKELVGRGYFVRASIRQSHDPEKRKHLDELGFEVVEADLLDYKSLLAATKEVQGVFQVAAGYKLHAKDYELEVRRPAVEGTVNLLRACHANGVKKIIYTSSIAAVGVGRDNTTLDENTWNTQAKEPYAKAKTEAEQIAWKLAEELKINLISILPGAVIGPDFQRHTPTTFIFRKILKNQIPLKLETGFPFVDVRDLAKVHVNAFESDTAHGRYVVCGDYMDFDNLFSVANAIDSKIKIPSVKVPECFLPLLPYFDAVESKLTGSMRTMTKGVMEEYFSGGRQLMNSNKAKMELGYDPTPIKKTIQDTLAWIGNHQINW